MGGNGFIPACLSGFAASGQDTIAFSVYDGMEVSNIAYPQFADDILRAAGFLKERQITGQHIGLVSANSYGWMVAFFGVVASGNVAVLLNPALPGDMLRKQCELADVSMIWSDGSADDEFLCAIKETQRLLYDEMMQALPMELADLHQAEPEETIVLLATSGTTGKSKIVEFSLQNIQACLADVTPIAGLSDRMLLVVPLYHVSGLISVLTRLQLRQVVCIGRGVKYMIGDMPVLNPAFVSMVPALLESLVKLLRRAKTPEQRQRYIGTSLRGIAVGGAGVNPELCGCMLQLGIQVQSAYAMTETTGVGTWCIWEEAALGSIGKPVGRMQCRIENGELLLKGPSVMKGYYRDPEETAGVIVDGWLHTGDLGYCDENGYYYITGRKKNVIILSNGENVNPEEIEAVFGECEAMEECLVYSDGKGICADVYAKNREAAMAYIKAYNETMPLYRQVYKVTYTEEPLPKTGSGKIKRKENKQWQTKIPCSG